MWEMIESFLDLVKGIGLHQAILICLLLFFVGCIIKLLLFISKRYEKNEEVAVEREKNYVDLIKQESTSLDEHTKQARDFHITLQTSLLDMC